MVETFFRGISIWNVILLEYFFSFKKYMSWPEHHIDLQLLIVSQTHFFTYEDLFLINYGT